MMPIAVTHSDKRAQPSRVGQPMSTWNVPFAQFGKLHTQGGLGLENSMMHPHIHKLLAWSNRHQ